jgi:hypothetical protein
MPFMMSLPHDFFGLEEVGDLDRRILVAVRTVDGVRFDRLGQFLADRAGLGVRRVGRAHDLAVLGDGVLAFQSQTQGTPVPAVGWGAANGGGASSNHGNNGGNNLFAPAPPDWWGPDLKYPNSTGSQNGARYAYFAQARRLAVEAGGSVFIYDTLDHQIGGFSQQQGPNGSMTCWPWSHSRPCAVISIQRW